jgi:hypothetical protein
MPPSAPALRKADDLLLERRLDGAYGAVRAAAGAVVLPKTVMFSSEEEVQNWQAGVAKSDGGIVLQIAAWQSLMAARSEARKCGLRITPRGPDAAARSYAQTVELWRTRVQPGLAHWVRRGKLSREEAQAIRSLPVREQTLAILRLEKQGLFFSKDFSKSIFSSVAPPGASQHLALLAFDVREHDDPRVRAILQRHGWHQTVVSDLPHFTYLGAPSEQLPSLGLMRIVDGTREYWVPSAPLLAAR